MLKEWSVRGERKRNPVGVGEKERGERERSRNEKEKVGEIDMHSRPINR